MSARPSIRTRLLPRVRGALRVVETFAGFRAPGVVETAGPQPSDPRALRRVCASRADRARGAWSWFVDNGAVAQAGSYDSMAAMVAARRWDVVWESEARGWTLGVYEMLRDRPPAAGVYRVAWAGLVVWFDEDGKEVPA